MYSKGVANAGQIVSRVLHSHHFDLPFACGMNIFNLDFINIVQTGMHSVGSLITPLALISVGLQLNFDSRSALAFSWIRVVIQINFNASTVLRWIYSYF
jgi:predicted permease